MEEIEGNQQEDDNQPNLNLNEFIEYKKLANILENELENKENKLNTLIKFNEELKSLHEKTRRECNELSQRLMSVHNEKSDLESKYQSELSKMKHNTERQRDVFEQQILKLSAYDPESLRIKLTAEIEHNYKQEKYKRDLDFDELNSSLQTHKRQHELLISEYKLYKQDWIRELNTLRENHQNEIRDFMHKMKLLSEQKAFSLDKEIKTNLEQEIEMLNKQNADLVNELDSLRKDKEELIIEKNELKMISNKDIDQERFHNKILIAENERLINQSFKLQEDVDDLKKANAMLEIDNQRLKEDKISYETMLNDQSEEYALFKEEMIQLRNQLEIRDKEIDITLNATHEKTQMQLMQEISQSEHYQTQNDDLKLKLNRVKIEYKNYYEYHSKELHEAKRDYLITNEEKNALSKINAILQEKLDAIVVDYDRLATLVAKYEKDYSDLQEKYRALSEKEFNFNNESKAYEAKIAECKKEIENLNAYIDMLKDNKQNTNGIKKKYIEVLEKKKYYKLQCVKANDNIKNLIIKLQFSEKGKETQYMKEHGLLFSNQSEESGF